MWSYMTRVDCKIVLILTILIQKEKEILYIWYEKYLPHFQFVKNWKDKESLLIVGALLAAAARGVNWDGLSTL